MIPHHEAAINIRIPSIQPGVIHPPGILPEKGESHMETTEPGMPPGSVVS
jgi:hypothetical protein